MIRVHSNVTDRQTDGQVDGRLTAA